MLDSDKSSVLNSYYNKELGPYENRQVAERESRNSVIYGIRLGVGIKDAFIDQIEAGYDRSSLSYKKTKTGQEFVDDADGMRFVDVDEKGTYTIGVHRVYLNAIKEFEIAKSTKLYALGGVGYITY
ncbi:MAG: hypothetical protein LBC09_02805, partial [Helicobacteraceae bacterium]|nr:hypothetical protein [Helicobacteraceae bacterium]